MQQERPTASFVLSLISGVIILIVGLILSFTSYQSSYLTHDTSWIPIAVQFFISGVVVGVIIIVGGVMLYSQPKQHRAWGIVVLIFSILSILSTGGLVIGLALGIIGGIVGIVWKPQVTSTLPSPPAPPAINENDRI